MIGTLGGVFEILLWLLMLFYGSIRNNMYIFHAINCLIKLDQCTKQNSRLENNSGGDILPKSKSNYMQRLDQNQVLGEINKRKSIPEKHPILFK